MLISSNLILKQTAESIETKLNFGGLIMHFNSLWG